MLFTLWLGIVIAAGESGCSTVKDQGSPPLAAETRRAVPDGPPVASHKGTSASATAAATTPLVRGLRNADNEQVPKVATPAAKNTYSSVHVNGRYIAMTFDDGPHAKNTPKLLDILKARNIKATFFLVGENVHEYPAIVRRILAEGHEIGNHTYTHPINMTRLSDEKIREEIGKTAKALEDAAGYHPRLYRPPGGNTNEREKEWFYNEYGYITILWSVDPNDWKKPGVSVVQRRLISGAQPGAIMLSHDIHAPTIEAIPDVLDTLLARGYQFVTVSQLINLEQPMPPSAVAATKHEKGKTTSQSGEAGGAPADPAATGPAAPPVPGPAPKGSQTPPGGL